MDFQIDYGSVPLAPRSTGPLYASVDGRVSSLANGEVVFFDAVTEQLHVMTEQVLGGLDICRPFRTLDEHAAAVRKAFPQLPQQGDAVKRVLENLVQRGLLLSDADWLARAGEGAQRTQAEFAGIFIRASDRPSQVQSLLDSLLEYERRFAPRHRYWLVDDSRDAANARRHATLLQQFGREAKVEARYVGADDWSAFVGKLGTDPAVTGWLLGRQREHGGGMAMTLIALLAAGRRFALLDDDFLFPLRLHPESGTGLDLQPGPQLPVRFYNQLGAALAAGREYDGDPLQAHLDACGATLGALLNHHPLLGLGRDDLAGIAPSRLPQLGRNRRVIATVNGHRGHSGAAGTGWMFALDATSRVGLWSNREDYLRNIDSPTLWYGPARTRLQAHGNFTPFTVDGSDMLPFTGPSGRGEDRLFGALCRFLDPDSLTAHLPTSVGHRQESERSRSDSLKQAFTPSMTDYLCDVALQSAQQFSAQDRALRLRGLASRLRDLAGASDHAIAGELREHLASVRSSLVQSLHSVLNGAKGAPVYWAADLRRLIEVNGKALIAGGLPKLAGWDEVTDEAGLARNYRDALTHHAEAMEAWPALWQAAREQGNAPA